jgi:hypothetical protein
MSLQSDGSGHRQPARRTDPGQFIVGMLAAAGTGAGLVSLPFMIMGPFVLFALLISGMVWAFGVTVLGIPAWLVLGWFGIRSRWAATCLGAALSGGVVAAYLSLDAQGGVSPWSAIGNALWAPLLIGMTGALAGFVGWGVAYRPDVPPSEAEIDQVFG